MEVCKLAKELDQRSLAEWVGDAGVKGEGGMLEGEVFDPFGLGVFKNYLHEKKVVSLVSLVLSDAWLYKRGQERGLGSLKDNVRSKWN
jgi:hypothetical protein